VDEGLLVEVLRIDDGAVDVGEDLELVRAADVIAVAGGAEGDDAPPVHGPHLLRLEWLDHPVVPRHPADPLVRLDGHVSCTTMAGNLWDMSRAFSAMRTATLRAISR